MNNIDIIHKLGTPCEIKVFDNARRIIEKAIVVRRQLHFHSEFHYLITRYRSQEMVVLQGELGLRFF